ncbi:MAG: phosphoenolpyruvate carboxykinase domain-containing protein, partial [Moraxellaceae bacterium]|nr:phosphoenolpyruvate carboxykinase domain-containing protein [Moraxellaceae bacterium]
IEGEAQGVEHASGISPRYQDIRWNGLDFGPELFEQVTSINVDEWAAELKLHDELFSTLAHNLPQELVAAKETLANRLGL